MMSKETAKKAIDLLFKMYEDNTGNFINKKTKGLVIDFIGGEQLLNVEVMDYICGYFIERCIETHHPWLMNSRFSMISNGTLYLNEDFQRFLKKYNDFLSFSVTIDGPKNIHDKCRVFANGEGSFDKAVQAEDSYNAFVGGHKNGTKVTIAPENVEDLYEIFKFFLERGKTFIHANPVYENNWSFKEAGIYYEQLKKIADELLLVNNDSNEDVEFSVFRNYFYRPSNENDLDCWCGGAGKMLAFDPDGIAYPCLRYMGSSLGKEVKPVIIGDVNGIYNTEEALKIKEELSRINRRTKNTDECFNCPISKGCPDCEAWNYQSAGGKFGVRSINICNMHRAESLANAYYWNMLYKKNKINKFFKMYLPKEDAIKIISEEEYNMLLELSTENEIN